MSLTRVTITGADDATSVDDLMKLTIDFPFVEWGVLVGSHEGERFPSKSWIVNLVETALAMPRDNPMHISLHVCGRHLRDIANGRSRLDEFIGPQLFAFRRVQLNWHGERQGPSTGPNVLKAFCLLDTFGWDPTLIFQLDGVNDHLFESSGLRFACVGLLDRSHGAGVLPSEWPRCSTEIACGWAGGLGPDNLADELPKIDKQAWPALEYWIDMETKVRTGSALDLHKVRQCLEISQDFMSIEVPR